MDKTKAKIQELCPDVMKTMLHQNDRGWQFGHMAHERNYWSRTFPSKTEAHNAAIEAGRCTEHDITLAVVLRAIETTTSSYSVSSLGYIERWESLPDTNGKDYRLTSYPNVRWNLEHDNYDQQSEECKQFIGSLLGV